MNNNTNQEINNPIDKDCTILVKNQKRINANTDKKQDEVKGTLLVF